MINIKACLVLLSPLKMYLFKLTADLQSYTALHDMQGESTNLNFAVLVEYDYARFLVFVAVEINVL